MVLQQTNDVLDALEHTLGSFGIILSEIIADAV
jgi:hypothetical protein